MSFDPNSFRDTLVEMPAQAVEVISSMGEAGELAERAWRSRSFGNNCLGKILGTIIVLLLLGACIFGSILFLYPELLKGW